eukprot:scaffold240020_cov19-Prasinocladus_malaysianus.AAC.1
MGLLRECRLGDGSHLCPTEEGLAAGFNNGGLQRGAYITLAIRAAKSSDLKTATISPAGLHR